MALETTINTEFTQFDSDPLTPMPLTHRHPRPGAASEIRLRRPALGPGYSSEILPQAKIQN